MPPRYSYWTIIAGGLPTAFRAAERAELEPTFQRIREKHPDAEMKWFARGKLWESPEAARRPRETRPGVPDRGGDRRHEPERREARGRDWRPGGEHRDPRQTFKDAKKARNQHRRAERFARAQPGARPARPNRKVPSTKPHGDKLPTRNPQSQPAHRDRPPRRDDRHAKSFGDRHSFKGHTRDARGAPPNAFSGRDRFERRRDHNPRRGPNPPGARAQGTLEPQPPPRPLGPNREPRPGENPEPSPPPRPSEPTVPPPAPPERGTQATKRKPT